MILGLIMKKIKVGILGATGAVGQRFIQLLENHPIFEVDFLMASKRSSGKKYIDAVNWKMDTPIPNSIRDIVVQSETKTDSLLLFSGLDSSVALEIERAFAEDGKIIISNSKNHRMYDNVPLLIPEVNYDHIKLVESQKSKGKIITNPNCSTTFFALVAGVLNKRWPIKEINVVTMQAISGAGYPGLPSYDILDNVIPYIEGEEEKMEIEPLKIMGKLLKDKIEYSDIVISSQANRVAVIDGHLENLSIKFKKDTPSVEEINDYLESFESDLYHMGLHSAVKNPIKVFKELKNRPQTRVDRMIENGMAVSVGRVRKDPIFDIKMVVLGHNTIKGAAGGAILNAELYCNYYLS